MVYTGKKGQKYEIQYYVIFRGGEDAGLRRYFWASKTKIKKVFDGFKFDNGGEVHVDMGHIVGNKKGEVSAKARFNKERFCSLEIEVNNKEEANKCVKYFGLGVPFNN